MERGWGDKDGRREKECREELRVFRKRKGK
jgi:hypothetical protein